MSLSRSENKNLHPQAGIPRSYAGPINVVLGQRVRELRKLRRMTQSDLAQQLDITFQQVQKYERGMNRISVSTLLLIADVLKVAPEILLAGALLSDLPKPAETAPCPSPEIFAEQVRLVELFGKISDPVWRTRVLDMVEMLGAAGRRDI